MTTEHKTTDLVDGPDAVAAESPRQPDVWADDDGATRIEAFDPAMLEALAAAHFPRAPTATSTDVPPIEETAPTHAPAELVRPVSPVPAPQPAPRVVAIPPLGPRNAPAVRAVAAPPMEVPPLEAKRPAPAARSAAAPERESRPAVATSAPAALRGPAPPGSDFHAAIAAIDMDLEPPPPPAAAPAPAPVVRAPVRGPLFEPELGPEPTQIGAMPLISFGQTRPLEALVGEQQHVAVRAAEPQATFLADSRPPFYRDRRVQIAVGAVAVVLLGVLILLVAR